MSYLLRLLLLVLVINAMVVAFGMSVGHQQETPVDLYVFMSQAEPQRLVIQDPYRNIRLNFAAPSCLDWPGRGVAPGTFDSLQDFYAWTASTWIEVSAPEALTFLHCGPVPITIRDRNAEDSRSVFDP